MFPELATRTSFAALGTEERVVLARRIAKHLGAEYEASSRLAGEEGFCTVIHTQGDCELVAVCGGVFQMGLSEADVLALSEYVNWTNGVAGFVGKQRLLASPVHDVEVQPFLVGVNPIVDPIGGQFPEIDEGVNLGQLRVLLAAAPPPMRLPSEAEIEYLCRAGGADAFVDSCAEAWTSRREFRGINRWGIAGLTDGEWVADAWHDNYDGAPSTSVPWDSSRGPGVFRGMLRFGPEQDDQELIFALAALRGKPAHDGYYRFRVAISLT